MQDNKITGSTQLSTAVLVPEYIYTNARKQRQKYDGDGEESDIIYRAIMATSQ